MSRQRTLPRLSSNQKIEILLVLVLLVSWLYFLPRWADWSQNSRLNLTLAIVDKGTLRIDDYYKNTGDYAKFEGHYYTDKAPGPSLLAVPIYAAIRPILQSAPVQSLMERIANSSAFGDTLNDSGTGLLKDKVYYTTVLYIATFFVSALPSAIMSILLFRFLQQIGASPMWSAGIVLIYGLATNAFTYAGAFFSHQLVAALLFSAFYIGFQIRRGALSPKWVLLAGLLLGYSLISEYPTFLIAAAVFFYIIFALFSLKRPGIWRWAVAFVVAGIPPGLLLMAYDMAIFGTLLPVGYEYSENYTDIHSTGFLSLTMPHADALWGITFSAYRGIFFVAPVLLLACLGFVIAWRFRQNRAEWLVCLWATVSFFLFNGSSVMWQGGFSVGPRYIVPMLPFFAVGLGYFAIQWGTATWARVLAVGLTIWSVFAVWVQTVGGQNYPPWDENPLVNYSLPNFLQGDIARNLGMIVGLRGIASIIPLLLVILVLVAFLIWLLRTQPLLTSPLTSLKNSRELEEFAK